MTDYELLSRMLSGDLPRSEVRELKARMKTEPQLAAAWEALHGLPDILASMPEGEVPPELNAAVLVQRRVRQLSRVLRVVPWALAAGVLLLVLAWPDAEPEPTAVIVEGRQVVEGDVLVLAGHLPVAIDGRAWISVEPPEGALREGSQEVNDMKLESIAAALAGAVVTVAVYEGSALINPGPDAVAVAAGESHTVGPPSRDAPAERPVTTRTSSEDLAEASREELTDRVGELEAELAGLRFEQQVSRGRLSSHEGAPQDWPEDVPEPFEPEAFKEAVAATFDGIDELELVSVDCEEFPCFAVVRSYVEGDSWSQSVQDQLEVLGQDVAYEGELKTAIWASSFGTDEGNKNFVAFASTPEELVTEEGSTRTSHRIESAINDLAEDAEVGDIDVE